MLSLEEARRRLAQLHRGREVARRRRTRRRWRWSHEKRNKAQLAMQRAQQVIDSLVIKAPFDGVVVAQGKPRRVGRHDLLGHGAARVPRRRSDLAGPAGGGRHRVRAHGSAREDRRERSPQPRRPDSRRSSRSMRCRARSSRRGSASCRGWPAAPTSSRSASVTRLFDVTLQFDTPDPRLKAGGSVRA